MNQRDMRARALQTGAPATFETIANDGVVRQVRGLTLVEYDIPDGCIGGYYPECNPLIPLWHHRKESKVPGSKSVPVRIIREV